MMPLTKMGEETQASRRVRLRASFGTQSNALFRKNVAFQKRKWGSNICLMSAPFLICCMLYVLDNVINHQLDSRSFRCGCKCTSCCDWIPIRNPVDGLITYQELCYEATDEQPCSPYASCNSYNDTECGYLFSTADQVGFCQVEEPPVWPALLQVPQLQFRDAKYPQVDPESIPNAEIPFNSAPILYTGDNPLYNKELMSSMWDRGISITDAVTRAYLRAQAAGQQIPTSTENQTIASEAAFIDAAGSLTRGLYEFGLVMGTSAFTSVTLLMEPAFVATGDGADSRPPLYFALGNCSALTPDDVNALSRIGQAITNMTGFPVECASLPPVRQLTVEDMTGQVFCGWKSSNCVYRNGGQVSLSIAEKAADTLHIIQEYVPLFDWLNTTPTSGLNVSVWMNNTNVARNPGVPDIQRWNQAVNLAANAYLKNMAGSNSSARLAGIRDMPKAATKLTLDFSSLLGPLFMMWFFQLMLPINVYNLVYEKEKHLRTMMKMQGLRDSVYYVVQYVWMVGMYCIFLAIFVLFGSLVGLKIFTLNDYGVQIMLYFLWGNLQASFSFWFASWQKEARSAVLLAVIYVIVTGFIANLVLIQFIEQGPESIANMMELLPAFGLFRGLYELAQYAFLANRNNGTGLTWAKLSEPGCGMIRIWFYFVIQWMIFPLLAYYRDQVTGGSTGVRRHPLFFLGYKNHTASKPSSWKFWLKKNKKTTSTATDTSSTSEEQQKEDTAAVVDPSRVDSLVSPTDYYYGSFTDAVCSPKLDGLLSEKEKIMGKSNIDASHLVAGKQSGIARKVTSVKLSVSDANASHTEGADVAQETQRVTHMWQNWSQDPEQTPPSAIILHELRKVYPSRDGNEAKVAVHDLSLAIQRCECFGLLGPNGAGKTTTIRMMEGFLEPSSGHAIIEGFNIQDDMDAIYCLMGACPQHDLLWDGLTAREHLLFYGRLKNLSGAELKQGVNEGLRSVNLQSVGNELVGSFSGGMKRRLSVAIALMGDPLLVYFDEPSTGLDPSSRRLLWEVIKKARKDKAVVLTTHSMEEAEALCDRLGIFVGGRLQCIGNPKDLTARFGGYLSFTITTPAHQEAAALAVVASMAPTAKLVYALGGTQKFELPIKEIDVSGVFKRMEEVKLRGELTLLDWGVSNCTLEEVFIKISRDAGIKMEAFN